jgi:predicted alpha-1,2-mannosidase
MRRAILILLPALLFTHCGTRKATPAVPAGQTAQAPPTDPVRLAEPIIGTGGHGHTFPGATVPFGMVQLSPDTRLDGWDGCGGYHHSDSLMYGFSHTHLSGTGVSDYGDILLMPFSGNPDTLHPYPHGNYGSPFHHAFELIMPGFYNVLLEKPQVVATVTATEHVGIHSYVFPKGVERILVMDLAHRDPLLSSSLGAPDRPRPEGVPALDKIHLVGHRHSRAWARNQQLFFAIAFAEPFTAIDIQRDTAGHPLLATLRFPAKPRDNSLTVRVGLSSTSTDAAADHIRREASLRNHDWWHYVEAAQQAWRIRLNKLSVQGGTETQQRVFYTALYHTMLAPNLWSDASGSYMGMDGKVHQLPPGDRQSTVFSLWDTFRANHPLHTLLEPGLTASWIRTFLRHYQEGGRLPVWELAANETDCMIGYHSAPVIVDAYMKGIRDFDANLALEAMVASGRQTRLGLGAYQRQGMIGAGDESESVSKTLEYAFDDWCVATFAQALGYDEIAAEFFLRAQYHRNLYDPATGFYRARMNGGWMERFDPREVNFNFTEANAWQYSLFAPHDIGTLMDMKGGPRGLEAHLDSLFSADSRTTGREQSDITGLIGQYAHGNEPSHHMAYLYAHCGAAHKTQALVRRIMDQLYTDLPDGLSGNEDCGQMSAWLVMSAMGLYPVTPGAPHYTIGTPWFEAVTLQLPDGKTFRITADSPSPTRPYIAAATLNGKPHTRPWISHAEILAGGELHFTMSDQPHPDALGDWQSLPQQRVPGPVRTPTPAIVAASQTLSQPLQVRIQGSPGAALSYSLDQGATWQPYTAPLSLTQDTRIQARAQAAGALVSMPASAEFFRIAEDRSIRLVQRYDNQYAAGGDKALIDRLRGGENFRTGRWQGYRSDLTATVDLGQVMTLRKVGAGFLQDIGSWIWLPSGVAFEVSADGQTFQPLAQLGHAVKSDDYTALTYDFQVACPPGTRARYVRMSARNFGVCPPWHLGAGGQAWIFADEFWVE